MNTIDGNIHVSRHGYIPQKRPVERTGEEPVVSEGISKPQEVETIRIDGLTDYSGDYEGLCINNYSWIRYVLLENKFPGVDKSWNDEQFAQFFIDNREQIAEVIPFVRWGQEIDIENPIHTFLFLERGITSDELIEDAYVKITKLFDVIASGLEEERPAAPEDILDLVWDKVSKVFNILFKANNQMIARNLHDDMLDCDGYASLMVAIGHEFGWPIDMQCIPYHVFNRWDDGERRFNFDQGNFHDDQYYIRGSQLSETSIANEYTLYSLTMQETIAHFYLLRANNVGNDVDQAMENLDSALLLHEHNFSALICRAELLHRIGNDKEALLLLDTLEENIPECIGIYSLRSNIYYDRGDIEAAIEERLRILDVGSWEESNSYYQNLVCDRSYLWVAQQHINEGNLESALTILEKALKLGYENYDLLYRYGWVLNRLGFVGQAITILEQAIDIDRAYNSSAYYWLGYIYYWEEQYDLALENLVEAQRRGSTNINVYLGIADIYYFDLPDRDLALEYYLRAERMGASTPSLFFKIADLYFGREDYENALSYFNRSEEEGYQDAELYYMRAVCYFENNQLDEAREDIRECLERESDHSEAQELLRLIEG
ncbi:tetratricopeptide repeat protein [Candidatus Margulisiibacteriota bacterium]